MIPSCGSIYGLLSSYLTTAYTSTHIFVPVADHILSNLNNPDAATNTNTKLRCAHKFDFESQGRTPNLKSRSYSMSRWVRIRALDQK